MAFRSQQEEQAIQSVIDQLWQKYDKDKSSGLDKEEMKRFVKDKLRALGMSAQYNDIAFDNMFQKLEVDKSAYNDKQDFRRLTEPVFQPAFQQQRQNISMVRPGTGSRVTSSERQYPPRDARSEVIPDQHYTSQIEKQENMELKRALDSVTEMLQNTIVEKDQLSQLFNDFKSHFQNIKSQCSSYQNKLVDEMTARKAQEQEFEQRVSQMKLMLENKQTEIEHLTQKMQLPVDQDILRMRIQKDLENKYRFELDSKSMELDKVSESYFETKRLHEAGKTELETRKIEYDKVISDMRRRHSEELQELVSDNQQLQLRIEDSTKDRDQSRQLRRDIDDVKRRLCEAQQESIELRKERDQLKIDKNELLIKNAKDVEEERNHRRVLQTENDKLRFQIKCFEDDLSKIQLKCERKTQEVQGALSEKTSLLTVLKEKEIMIDSIRRQLSQTKEDLHLKEQELDAYVRRAVAEDKDKSLIERKEKTRIHKELETLEKNYMELSHQRKADLSIKQNEIDNLNKVILQLEESKTKNTLQIDNHEVELRELKKKLAVKVDQHEVLEKEYQKLQEKYRDAQNNEFNLSTLKEQQDATVKIQEDQLTKLTNRYQDDEKQWKIDKQELTKQIQDLYIQLDKTKREAANQIQQFKGKYNDYKVKVKQANGQINLLAQKLAQSEQLRNQGSVAPTGYIPTGSALGDQKIDVESP